jgi:hypothetical protein
MFCDPPASDAMSPIGPEPRPSPSIHAVNAAVSTT